MVKDVFRFFKLNYPLAYQADVSPTQFPIHLPRDEIDATKSFHVHLYQTLTLPVPDFQDSNKVTVHHMRATGQERFRNQTERSDWVWVRHSLNPRAKGTINRRVPARLNAIFKLQNKYQVWRLAHVTFLTPMNGNLDVQGSEQMSRVRMPSDSSRSGHVVRISDILGMIHLIPVDQYIFFVNDRIDLTTWNDLS